MLEDSHVLRGGQFAFVYNGGVEKCVMRSRAFSARCRREGRDRFGVYIDLAAAYDTVTHEVLEAALRRVGLPPRFTNFVTEFHRNTTARVRIGTKLGAPFPIERSVAQGSPLAPLLFVLVIEALQEHVDDQLRLRAEGAADAQAPRAWHADPDFDVAEHDGIAPGSALRHSQAYADDLDEGSDSCHAVAAALEATARWANAVGMAVATRPGKNVGHSSLPIERLNGLGLCVKIDRSTGDWSVRAGRRRNAHVGQPTRPDRGYDTLWVPFLPDGAKVRYLGVHTAGSSANRHEVARLAAAVSLGVSAAYTKTGPLDALNELVRVVHPIVQFSAPHVLITQRRLDGWDRMVSKMLHFQMGGMRHVAGYVWESAFGYERLSHLYHRVRAHNYVVALRGRSEASHALMRHLLAQDRAHGRRARRQQRRQADARGGARRRRRARRRDLLRGRGSGRRAQLPRPGETDRAPSPRPERRRGAAAGRPAS